MDIFSHGLWVGAAAKSVNVSQASGVRRQRLNVYWAMFWGAFPDFFAFTIPFLWIAGQFIMGRPVAFPRPEHAEPLAQGTIWPLQIALRLYHLSHSAIIFLVVFFITALVFKYYIRRGIPWVISGWLIHILMDIPTHSYKFFPTPVFWPLFGWKFDGISWATPRFLIMNYTILIIVCGFLRFARRRKHILLRQ